MRKYKLRIITFVLLALMIVVSSYLALADLLGSEVCIINADGSLSNCSTVQNSKYGEFFGIKLVWYGLAAFIILFVLYFLNHKHDDKTHHHA